MMRGWITGCWGHKEEGGSSVVDACEPLLEGRARIEHSRVVQVQEDDDDDDDDDNSEVSDDAEMDRKLLWEETEEAYVPRQAALSFLKSTARGARRYNEVRNRKGARGLDVIYC
jgi:hypothetical protein